MPDPFHLLGIEPCFQVDTGHLEARHRELSRALHPDRFVGRPSAERRLALSKAIEVNQALRVVRDPVRRAEALLERRGIEFREGESFQPSQDFLAEILELRETLAEAAEESDLAKVESQGTAVASRQRSLLEELARAFESLDREDSASRRSEILAQIRNQLAQVRYYQRFLEEVRTIEDELG